MKITMMKTDDLIPYAGNAKQHPEWQINQIASSIREYGMNDPIAIWHDKAHNNTPVIVEGHGRLLALQKLGIETVPTISLDHLNDAQRKAYTLIHNKLTMNTGFAPDMLEAELEALAPDIDLSDYGLHVTMPDEMPDYEDDEDLSALYNPPEGSFTECPKCHYVARSETFKKVKDPHNVNVSEGSQNVSDEQEI